MCNQEPQCHANFIVWYRDVFSVSLSVTTALLYDAQLIKDKLTLAKLDNLTMNRSTVSVNHCAKTLMNQSLKGLLPA